jgi:glycosyltransferase involved in cell wall biosynthesis
MTHPAEWPDLCRQYPVARYVQHSAWAADLYRPFFGDDICAVWPVGIDTEEWQPAAQAEPSVDFLLYNKIRWDHARREAELAEPIRDALRHQGLTFTEIRYGHYKPPEYAAALRRCRAMLFVCEHESQGLAYQEALSSGVPILAWDPGEWLDPQRFAWGTPHVPATSVPYFDPRCGERFWNFAAFPDALGRFMENLRSGRYAPRDYILEHLTLDRCARHYIQLLNDAAEGR